MIKKPLISIITPSYNQVNYLENTIQSIINQNYHHFEYIIMDGGSTDGSVNIIKKYSKYLSYWESNQDKGQADAIYRGLQKANGDIVGWINSDDLLLPGALEKVAKWFMKNLNQVWVVGGTIAIDSKNKLFKNRYHLPLFNLGEKVTFNKLYYYGCTFNQPASFWRKNIFFSIGGFDTSLQFSFDFDLFLNLAKHQTSGHISDFLALFRYHSLSKTSTLNNVKNIENILLLKKYQLKKQSNIYLKFRYYVYFIFEYVKKIFIWIMYFMRIIKLY